VNVSAVKGSVRRSFDNLIHVDAALYGGSSGGPVIDSDGKVIGIASGVAVARASGLIRMPSPVWNMAMVQPITTAVIFLDELKGGKVKWNGVIDLSARETIKQVMDDARQGLWAKAAKRIDSALTRSLDPQLVLTGAMVHFCKGDMDRAEQLFQQSVSIDAENYLAKLMLYIIDWLADRSAMNPHRRELIHLDWRSPAEFFGYVARFLEGGVTEASALDGWDSLSEKSWLLYAAGLIRSRDAAWAEAERFLRTAIQFSEPDDWSYFLSRTRLEAVQKKQLTLFKHSDRWAPYRHSIEAFEATLQKDFAAKKERRRKMEGLQERLRKAATAEDKRMLFDQILELFPDNGNVMARVAFYHAMQGKWGAALPYAERYLKRPGRESAVRLSTRLLSAQIMQHQGNTDKAKARLQAMVKETGDHLYGAIGETLLGKRTVADLKGEAGENPQNLMIVHYALGLWAESAGETVDAIRYYKVSLESLLDQWIEFEFSRERINRLKKKSG
jgi:tetratricopeptide (TPR) repeat protein